MDALRKIDEPKHFFPHYPKWLFDDGEPKDIENASFFSGSSLSMLYVLLTQSEQKLPHELLRKRLAVKASKNCLKLEGRVVETDEIRDAFYLAQPGDALGPAGDMLALWRKACMINIRHRGWMDRIAHLFDSRFGDDLGNWFQTAEEDRAYVNPVSKSHAILSSMISAAPQEETAALICADAVLARSLGWSYIVPLASISVRRNVFRDLLAKADWQHDLRDRSLINFHRSVSGAAKDVYRYAHELTRRAERILEVSPKLRTNGSEAAVKLFLTEDLILPSVMLSPKIRGSNFAMTSRSARRLCDRLIKLQAITEVTGRSTFRLYGL